MMIVRVILIVMCSTLFVGCSGAETDEPPCLSYTHEDNTDGITNTYDVLRNIANDNQYYCAHNLYQNSQLVRTETKINDGLCKEIIAATQNIDHTNVSADNYSNMLSVHDGDTTLINGPVDIEKVKPILDVLYAGCPNFDE